jgi:3-oxoadipate enol-lactonase
MAWADLTDVRCYYETLGEGEPLLLIPGLGTTRRMWDSIAPDLASFFSLILIDNRSIGLSVAKRPPNSTADWAADIVELLDRLQLTRVDVLGVSLGGVIAQRLAIDHPSRIDRLVLVSCADCFSPYLRQMAGLLGHSLRHFPHELFVRTVELLGTSPEYLDANPQQVEQRVLAKCRSPISSKAIARQLRALSCSEIDSRHYHISAPTLVIAGEHDAMIPSCYSRRMAERIPESCFMVVPGAGHNPLVDVPERVLPEVIEFLQASAPKAGASWIGSGGAEAAGGHRRFSF